MITFEGVTWRAAVMGRWTALLLGTLMVLFFLAFAVGEGLPVFSSLTLGEKLQFAAIAILFVGLALSWKWEGLGGLLAVIGFVFLVAISRTHLRIWLFWVPAAIGIVHVACWSRLRVARPASLVPWHFSWPTILAILAPLAAFLALSANEIFGEPPLMTPALRPAADLATTWQSVPADALLAIHPDASVTGTIQNTALTNAHITNNRTWFGRLLHWRYDYRIQGHAAGVWFILALQRNGPGLDGWLWMLPEGSNRDVAAGRPVKFTLRKP